MNRESILERIDSFRAALRQMEEEKTKLIADMNATDGAIQDCEYWLSVIDPALELIEGGKCGKEGSGDCLCTPSHSDSPNAS